MRKATGIGSYHNARSRHLHIPECETVCQVDKQIRLEKIIDELLIGLVVGLLIVNVVNQAGKAWGWW